MMLKRIILIIAMLLIGISITEAQSKITKQEIINAIKQGANSTKKLLEKVPIDYYQDDNTLLHYAVQFRKRGVVELLVNRKILISRKGGIFYGTALQDAIYYGHLGIASYLLEKGSLVNIKNIDGDTALHIAARNGYLGIVEQLIAYGASKNMPNANGHTAYNLIPDLSWDSRKKLQEVLATQPIQVQTKNYSKSILNRNIHSTKNRNINIIDKKSLIDNSSVGIDININRINQF
ncbi:MAG TPA: ankyrin repeat domain-containing protein [Campylobacterales bacterium]|nr:ankyrin repeat domain-containing protein [Campylobacterales bacterium]